MENFPIIIHNAKNNEKLKVYIHYDISMISLLKKLSDLLKYEVYSLYVNKVRKTDIRDIKPNSIILASDKFQVVFSEDNYIEKNYQNDSVISKIQIKILFLGKPRVGKTSLIIKYIKNLFVEKYIPTIKMEYEMVVENNSNFYHLLINDLGGSDIYSVLYDSLIEYHNVFVVCLSCESLDQKNIFSYCSHIEKIKPNCLIFLIITKMDLIERKSFSNYNLIKKKINSLKNFSKQKGWYFMMTSSKTNDNILKLFKSIIKNFYYEETKEITFIEKQINEDFDEIPNFLKTIKNSFCNYFCYKIN